MQIDTTDLELGMFVAQLDRPWLDTPFLFQGFEIREDGELELLRKLCRHVYVDVTRGSLPPEKVRSLGNRKAPQAHAAPADRAQPLPKTAVPRPAHAISSVDPTGTVATKFYGTKPHRNSVPTQDEAPKAARAYDSAAETVNQVMHQIKKGAGIDVDKLQTAVRPMIDSVLRNQDAMAWLIYLRKRDEYTYHHSIASSVWAMILGRHLGFNRQGLDTLAMGGMLLDIGKTSLPPDFSTKTDPLTPAELETMKRHVASGLEMARQAPGINAEVLAMIENHHERADGSGYPRGLSGADIPVFGRIAGLVDSYDAMTSQRPWASAKSPYDAIRELNSLAGTRFQKELVEQFVQALGMFPTGSLVELNTGELGIVVEQNRVRRLRPKIMIVLDEMKEPLHAFKTVDLRQCPSDMQELGARWIVRGHESGAFGIDSKNYFIG